MVIFHDYLPFSYEVYPHPVSVLSEVAFVMKCQNAVNVLKLWDEQVEKQEEQAPAEVDER